MRVMFYPFVMMDMPAGNGLPDPYGGAEQAAFPWRGRITCHPGAGPAGTADKTAAAATRSRPSSPNTAHGACITPASASTAGGVDSLHHRLGAARADAGALERPATAPIRPCRRSRRWPRP